MRWPWRRRGRRRRADVTSPRQVATWDTPGGGFFLPQGTLPGLRHASTVRLGFSDGSEVELDESAVMTASLLAAARVLVGRADQGSVDRS